ncbi:HalX domain-containing protein [Halosolutus amylolyticus]|uniref:HalX domain-containing protein n=1 Tax=Halosolutus amylolyticus TaxID=2932267 RepID=A0ABD5PMT9_9EURY|nr:HalX domain-containing protein [Halosolutus amylolyticus]
MPDDRYTVLVVDDGPGNVELFERWLSDEYRVGRATGGDDSLEELDDVDVALLDRDLPTVSGTPLALEIDRRAADCLTAIVSGIEPGADVLYVSCGECLVTPVEKEELLETVERLRHRARYDERLAECANLAARRGALEATHSRSELEDDEEFLELRRRITDLLGELDDMTAEFDAEDFQAAFETPDFTGRPRVRTVGWPS